MTTLDHAIEAANRGWYVFACKPNSKEPAEPWRERSTNSIPIIRARLEGTRRNYGIDCEKSGLLVVDCDVKNGVDGRLAFMHFMVERGLWPLNTRVIRTPSRGTHVIYRSPGGVRNNAKTFLPGVDIRGEGGYIVGEGSRIGAGAYVVHPDYDLPVADAPAALLDALRPKLVLVSNESATKTVRNPYVRAALTDELDKLAETQPGMRNYRLFVASAKLGQIVAVGALDREDVFDSLFAVATRIGLGEQESIKTIESGLRAGERQPRDLRLVGTDQSL